MNHRLYLREESPGLCEPSFLPRSPPDLCLLRNLLVIIIIPTTPKTPLFAPLITNCQYVAIQMITIEVVYFIVENHGASQSGVHQCQPGE